MGGLVPKVLHLIVWHAKEECSGFGVRVLLVHCNVISSLAGVQKCELYSVRRA